MTAIEPRFAFQRVWLALGLAGCGVLVVMSLLPNPPSADISHFDKVQHFAAYAVLGAWFGALRAPHYAGVFIGLVMLGGVIEIAQAMTTYRSGDVWDGLADGLGVLAGLGLAHIGAMRWLRYIDARVAANRNRTG